MLVPLSPDRGLPFSTNSVLHVQPQIIVGLIWSRAGLAPVQGWNRFGSEEDLFCPTPPHNSGMPSWPGYRSHHHHHHHHNSYMIWVQAKCQIEKLVNWPGNRCELRGNYRLIIW